MAYTRNTLRRVLDVDLASGAGMWLYQTADWPEDIAAVNGYFVHAREMGMKVNDPIMIVNVTSADSSGSVRLYSLVELLADGRGNLSPKGAVRA